MKWLAALKIYNKNKGRWCIPKKGTAEYAKVKDIMNEEVSLKKKTTTSSINVADAMAKNQARRGQLFTSFESRMKAMDLAKKIRGFRVDY